MSNFMTLLVEDDALQREVLADILRDDGFEVVECSTAEAAELIVASTGTELRALISDRKSRRGDEGLAAGRIRQRQISASGHRRHIGRTEARLAVGHLFPAKAVSAGAAPGSRPELTLPVKRKETACRIAATGRSTSEVSVRGQPQSSASASILTTDFAREDRATSVAFSSFNVASRSEAASAMPSSSAQVRNVP